ncbi:MAG: thymidine phosphorylase [Pseudomonadota bacterium]
MSTPGFLPQETIRKKRDGLTLSDDEIAAFIGGVTHGSVTEGQVAAFCMATVLKGMTMPERVALTRSMTQSGRVLDWPDLDGPVLDKHSTGGVGDKVSLILGPAIAACGGYNPMISGRGLGHTGGTLDKFDSIPGYQSQPDLDTLRRVVRDAGTAIIGATSDIAPADRRMYAIRDVTGTVESIDLITASILSKKLAARLGGLVMDVKFGSGAFAAKLEDAIALAESIAHVGSGAGTPTVALLTDMNQVLGTTAGNAVEVAEAVKFMTGGEQDARLYGITRDLVAEALVLGGLADHVAAAAAAFDQAIQSGAAAERFGRMVAGLGGPADFIERCDFHLPTAAIVRDVSADGDGIVTEIDTRKLGLAVVAMGGGRTRPEDAVDHAVGLTQVAGIGDRIGQAGKPLAQVHAASEASAEQAIDAVRRAFTIGDEAPAKRPLIAKRVTAPTP